MSLFYPRVQIQDLKKLFMGGTTYAEVSLDSAAVVPSDADFICNAISAAIISMATPCMVD